MILFKKKFFSMRIKMLLVHLLFYTLIMFFISCSVLHLKICPAKSAISAAILFLTLEQLFNNFFFNQKLNVKDDEFLRYKYCKSKLSEKSCKTCSVDSLLEIIFQYSPDVITFKDSNLRYSMCSKKFVAMTKFKNASDIIGKTPKEILPEEQASVLLKYNNIVLKTRTPKTFMISCRYNGEDCIYDVISTPIISNSEVVGVLTLSRDITDTFNLKESLAMSNSKLVTLLNNSPMLAYIVDIDGNFVLGNDRAKILFLQGIDTILSGEKIHFDIDVFKSEIMEEDVQVLKEGKSIQYEKSFLAKNGERYWYWVNKTPLINSEGKIYAISTFARSIEQEKRLAEQRETYIATLSHDLKTPTIAQVRALELLLSGQLGELNDEQREMIKLTLDSCNYMYDMVYTLLSTYKFENGDIALNYSSFDINKMITESIHEISNLATENSITIEFSPKKEHIVNADRIELKRVIVNLLSNAINYAFSGTKVHVDIKKTCKNIEVRVQNSGHYIEPSTLSGLFRKYVTHSEKFNKVGIGLGLYLSKKIVEAHNGKIICESTKQQKNTFGFSIPVCNVCEVHDNAGIL